MAPISILLFLNADGITHSSSQPIQLAARYKQEGASTTQRGASA